MSEGFEDVARWEREKVGGHPSKHKHILSISFPGSTWENVLSKTETRSGALAMGLYLSEVED